MEKENLDQYIREFIGEVRLMEENQLTGNVSIQINIVNGNVSNKYNISVNKHKESKSK